jgi:Uma2 family endonuclease
MASAIKEKPSATWDFPRLRRHLGMIPAERILMVPYPGTAKPKDVVYWDEHFNVICELVDGILVRKPMGAEESMLASFLCHLFWAFLTKHDLGLILGEAGFLELMKDQVRAPDVSFISWSRLPEGRLPEKKIPFLAPDLAVEILSESNTTKEMERKRREYFDQGTRLVWLVDPRTKAVEVFTSPEESTVLQIGETLDGGDVLPGFKLKLGKLFGRGRKRG